MSIEIRFRGGTLKARVVVPVRNGAPWASPWEDTTIEGLEETVRGLLNVGRQAIDRFRGVESA